MNYDYILALDPSGSYHEGKGTTGWNVYSCLDRRVIHAGSITAKDYTCMEAYWDAQLALIAKYHERFKDRLVVVIEDYLLYATQAQNQINSRMETCKLIGAIQHYCWICKIPYVMQTAREVKARWTDDILTYKHIIKKRGKNFYVPINMKTKITHHCIDSIRHSVHYATFKNETKGAVQDAYRKS